MKIKLINLIIIMLLVLSGNAIGDPLPFTERAPAPPCFGIILGKNVNVHSEPCTTSEVVATIAKEMKIVEINEVTSSKHQILFSDPVIEYPWISIKYKNVKKGYVSGQYIEMVDTRIKAEEFVKKNMEFWKSKKGKWIFRPSFDKYYHFEVTLNENGTLLMKSEGGTGDYHDCEKGTGRYYFNPYQKYFKFYAYLAGKSHYTEGGTWEKLFERANSRPPKNKTELKKFIKKEKEDANYKIYREFKIVAEDWEHDLKHVLVQE